MSNTRKTRKPDPRANILGQLRRKQKRQFHLEQELLKENARQRAAHAAKLAEEKTQEMAAKLLSGEITWTEIQEEVIDDIAQRYGADSSEPGS